MLLLSSFSSPFATVALWLLRLCVSDSQQQTQYVPNIKPLTCDKKSNRFKIVQFTDLHFGESVISNHLTVSLMNTILSEESPHLVVLSGDIVSGYCWDGVPSGPSGGWFTRTWDFLVQPMIQHNVPWVFTSGNHDVEADLNTSQIFAYDHAQYSHLGSLTQLSDPYTTPIYSTRSSKFSKTSSDVSDTSETPSKGSETLKNVLEEELVHAASVVMIDTGSKSCGDDWEYFGCMRPSALESLKQRDASAFVVPSLVFMHISVPDISDLYRYNHSDKYKQNMNMKSDRNDTNLPYLGSRSRQPECYDNSAMGGADFIDVVREKFGSNATESNIVSILHGHDHDSDYVYLGKNDIMHGFGRRGARGFMIEYDAERTFLAGARVLEFDCSDPKHSWHTWIRDFQNGVYFNTSYAEMKDRKARFDAECEQDMEWMEGMELIEQECFHAYEWAEWKPIITTVYRHWLGRRLVNLLDVLFRCLWYLEYTFGWQPIVIHLVEMLCNVL